MNPTGIAKEFAACGCSVAHGTYAGVDCLMVSAEGRTILVLLETGKKAKDAADLWRDEVCYCTERSTAAAIARCLQAGEFDAHT